MPWLLRYWTKAGITFCSRGASVIDTDAALVERDVLQDLGVLLEGAGRERQIRKDVGDRHARVSGERRETQHDVAGARGSRVQERHVRAIGGVLPEAAEVSGADEPGGDAG